MSPDLQSTIGRELRENYALQLMDELQFVKTLTADQPFVPKYFGYDVEMNKKGAPTFEESISAVPKVDRQYSFRKEHTGYRYPAQKPISEKGMSKALSTCRMAKNLKPGWDQ